MILELRATPEEVMRAVTALETFAHERGVPEATIYSLALALEESGSNVVNHALQRDPEQSFRVTLEHAEGTFTIELRDRGPEFDPTALARKHQAEDADAPGGWGTELVRRQMDEVRYTREAGENVLRLTRHLQPTTA